MTKRATQQIKKQYPFEWEQARGFFSRYLISTDGRFTVIDQMKKILKPQIGIVLPG
jgi:hypothetical protein